MSNQLKLLDCTLRDGGYYNSWDFDRDLVIKYLSSMTSSKVDYVEIGFRYLPDSKKYLGPYAYTTEDFLKSLNISSSLKLGVMINADEYLSTKDPSMTINKNFLKAEDSSISLVRIAINFDKYKNSKVLIDSLKDLGYLVGLNLMQSHSKTDDELKKTSEEINSWKKLDILYFADSLGSMEAGDVDRITSIFKKEWSKELGIHTHNNKGFGLSNSIQAIKSGVNWVDATVTGMGRGAGNTSTENLLLEMNSLDYHKGDPLMLVETVENFQTLKDKYKWGTNIYYHYAALRKIHPTYVQSILSGDRYDSKQIFSALDSLSSKESSSYSLKKLEEAIYSSDTDSRGSWNPESWLEGKDVMLIGAGPSVETYKEEIVSLCEREGIVTFFLNTNKHLPNKIAKATIVSQVSRALSEFLEYEDASMPLIMPKERLAAVVNISKKIEILDYGLQIEKGTFEFHDTFCNIETPLVTAYALGIMHRAGAKRIFLAGFDGYEGSDERNQETENALAMFKDLLGSPEVISITPTSYINLTKSSIFSPIIKN